MLNQLDKIPCIELNISCPNVKAGGMGFGTQPKMAEEVVSKVRAVYNKPIIVKLTPNVTSIAEIAKAVEAAGADSVSLINTVLAMAVDAEKQRPMKIFGIADAIEARDTAHHNHIPASRQEGIGGRETKLIQLHVDGQILLDIGVGAGDVCLGLIIVII